MRTGQVGAPHARAAECRLEDRTGHIVEGKTFQSPHVLLFALLSSCEHIVHDSTRTANRTGQYIPSKEKPFNLLTFYCSRFYAHVNILYTTDSLRIRSSIRLSGPLHLFILGGKNLGDVED